MSTKTAVQSEHGKVHQTWMCYTNPFTSTETWAAFEVSHSNLLLQPGSADAHKWFDAACGPEAAVVGQNYLFITPVTLVLWLICTFLPGAVRDLRADPLRPWTSGIPTFYSLCAEVFSQHISIQSAPLALRAAANLLPDPQTLTPGHKKKKPPHDEGKSFKGLVALCCPISHMDSWYFMTQHTDTMWKCNVRVQL